MTQDQEKLTRIYEAFNRRDIPEVLSMMHEDVLWPNGWEGGYVTGQQEVRDYWLRQWKEVDPVVVPVAFQEGNDGKIITVVHQVVKDKEGKLLFDGNILHVYELKDGLISNMEIQEYIPS